MRANTGVGLMFGFASIGLFQKNVIVGMSQITGSFSAEVSPELVSTMGGAANFPIAARRGRASGEGSIVLHERPSWIETSLLGGNATNTAAASAASVDEAITNLIGTSMTTALAATGSANLKDRIRCEVVAESTADNVTVKVVGSGGAYEFNGVSLTETAVEVGNTGLMLALQSGQNLSTEGDSCYFSIAPAHGGLSVVEVPQVQSGQEYEVRAYSARGGQADAIYEYVFPRVAIGGANISMTDVDNPGDIELAIVVLAPSDGGSIYSRRILQPA